MNLTCGNAITLLLRADVSFRVYDHCQLLFRSRRLPAVLRARETIRCGAGCLLITGNHGVMPDSETRNRGEHKNVTKQISNDQESLANRLA
jgi:ribosomal protein S8